MDFSRRDFLRLIGLGGAGALFGLRLWERVAPAMSEQVAPATLRLLTTSRVMRSPVITAFTDSTGFGVDLTVADEPDSLAGFDLAIVPTHTLTRLIQRGAVRELDSLPLPFELEQRAYDPFNVFSRRAGWGAVGINARGVKPPESWAKFFEAAQLMPTHLPPADSFHAALKMMGESINTRNTVVRSKARELVNGLVSAPLLEAQLAAGARRAGWEFAVPGEGAERWEDCFCVPVGSRRPDLAHKFIRFAIDAQPITPLPDAPLEPRSPFAPAM